MIDTDIELTPAIEREFRCGANARAAIGAVAQAKLNAAVATDPRRTIDGVGQLVARVDPDVYWAMRLRFGSECWRDPAFRRSCQSKGLITAPPTAAPARIVRP